ncbi:MAG: hypothetical protein V4572_05005 [Bacteroidota bacterium]
MKKIITIAILFFSYLSFAQTKPVETLPVEKSGTSTNVLSNDESTSMKSDMLKKSDDNCGNFYKKKSNIITENPLNDIKLRLPNNFNWLLHSIVSSDKKTVGITALKTLDS